MAISWTHSSFSRNYETEAFLLTFGYEVDAETKSTPKMVCIRGMKRLGIVPRQTIDMMWRSFAVVRVFCFSIYCYHNKILFASVHCQTPKPNGRGANFPQTQLKPFIMLSMHIDCKVSAEKTKQKQSPSSIGATNQLFLRRAGVCQ